MKRRFWVAGALVVAVSFPLYFANAVLNLDSTCMGYITAPSTVYTGSTFTATATLRNDGRDPWTKTQLFYLGSQNPQDNLTWGLGRVPLPSSTITYRNNAVFTFSAKAPAKPGKYSFVWQMVQEKRAWFGQKCQTRNDINVISLTPTPTPTPRITPTPAPTPTPTPIAPYDPGVPPVDGYSPDEPTPGPYTNPAPSTPLTATILQPKSGQAFNLGQDIPAAVTGNGSPSCGYWTLRSPSGEVTTLYAKDFVGDKHPGTIPSCVEPISQPY